MKKDIPILSVIPQENISLYSIPETPDKLRLFIAIAGITTVYPFNITENQNS